MHILDMGGTLQDFPCLSIRTHKIPSLSLHFGPAVFVDAGDEMVTAQHALHTTANADERQAALGNCSQ